LNVTEDKFENEKNLANLSNLNLETVTEDDVLKYFD
jgi:hypothetical protein